VQIEQVSLTQRKHKSYREILASRLLPPERCELRLKNLVEDFMKKQVRSLWFIGALVLFLSVGMALNAQTTPQTQSPDAQAQQPATPPDQAQPGQTPAQTPSQTPRETQDQAGKPASSAQGESAQAAGAQSFTGTVVKADGKYVFQDEASGNTYDIDRQEEVQKFEGKKVKVRGTLDANSKMIHIQ
jgi:hypothetical protein